MAKILIGASGFPYDDGKGIVYPDGLESSDFLSSYSQEFPAVELNLW
jgi:uncharacterized protein YecE (DUF72 family)